MTKFVLKAAHTTIRNSQVNKMLKFPKIGQLEYDYSMQALEGELLQEIEEQYDILETFDSEEEALKALAFYKNSAQKKNNCGRYFWNVGFYWVEKQELEYNEDFEEWEYTESYGSWFAEWEPDEEDDEEDEEDED